MNAGKSKVMMLERRDIEVVDFGNLYRVSVPMEERCEIVMGGERMEVVKEFKYLGTVFSKHRGKEVKRGLRNSILLPTLMYESEMWTWTRAQQSRLLAVKMSYLKGACGVTRWAGESKESIYERYGMGSPAN